MDELNYASQHALPECLEQEGDPGDPEGDEAAVQSFCSSHRLLLLCSSLQHL